MKKYYTPMKINYFNSDQDAMAMDMDGVEDQEQEISYTPYSKMSFGIVPPETPNQPQNPNYNYNDGVPAPMPDKAPSYTAMMMDMDDYDELEAEEEMEYRDIENDYPMEDDDEELVYVDMDYEDPEEYVNMEVPVYCDMSGKYESVIKEARRRKVRVWFSDKKLKRKIENFIFPYIKSSDLTHSYVAPDSTGGLFVEMESEKSDILLSLLNEFKKYPEYINHELNFKESVIKEGEKFVVVGTANGKKGATISKAMDKKAADEFKKNLEKEMSMAIDAYKWAKDLKVVKESVMREAAQFIIFKDNEPYEVVGSKKEADSNVEDYRGHKDNKGSKFEVAPLSKYEDKLKKLKPKSYKKLQDLKKQADKVSKKESVEIKEAKVDEKAIIKELIETGWSGDNESQMKAVQLLKGLATSDSPEANAFMKKLDTFTSGLKSEKKESYNTHKKDLKEDTIDDVKGKLRKLVKDIQSKKTKEISPKTLEKESDGWLIGELLSPVISDILLRVKDKDSFRKAMRPYGGRS
jgi:hypothetical protein